MEKDKVKRWRKTNNLYYRYKGSFIICKVIIIRDNHFISKIKNTDISWELKSFYNLFQAILWTDLQLMSNMENLEGFIQYEV